VASFSGFVTELLIQFGFDDLHRADADGKTPLMLAEEREGHDGIAEYVAFLKAK